MTFRAVQTASRRDGCEVGGHVANRQLCELWDGQCIEANKTRVLLGSALELLQRRGSTCARRGENIGNFLLRDRNEGLHNLCVELT